MKEKLKNYLSKISQLTKDEFKEDYEFLKDYHESNLVEIKEFLEDIKTTCSIKNILQAIDEELNRRKKISEEFIGKLKEKYLNQYIRYNLKDGLGSYMVFKVQDIRKVFKDYCDLCYSISVSNVDGDYSINKYKDASIKLYSDLEEDKLELITEEDYKEEFNKAIEYYKSLGE